MTNTLPPPCDTIPTPRSPRPPPSLECHVLFEWPVTQTVNTDKLST